MRTPGATITLLSGCATEGSRSARASRTEHSRNARAQVPKHKRQRPRGRLLGPGFITGASDEDPSNIATYSQVGAQFGYGMLWTTWVLYPLVVAIQEISA